MENHQEKLLYGELTARIRKMLEPMAHDSFLFFDDTIAFLKQEIYPGCKVFDAGCGRGTITSWLAEEKCEVVAIDSNRERVLQTKHLLEEKNMIDRVQVEESHLPDSFPDDHFQVILDCFSWWHISDWGRLLNLSRKNMAPQGKIIILDTFFGWKTTLDFRQQMRELWHTALPTYNECKNMLVKREFMLSKTESVQDSYIRYLDALCNKIHELEREDLGASDPQELQNVKKMWEWFLNAARAEELVATLFVAELTVP